jgi:hypothetical protein
MTLEQVHSIMSPYTLPNAQTYGKLPFYSWKDSPTSTSIYSVPFQGNGRPFKVVFWHEDKHWAFDVDAGIVEFEQDRVKRKTFSPD